MSKPRTPPRLLRVRRITQLAPQLRRVTLVGTALAGFPEGEEGSHIKLMLAREGQVEPVLPTLGPDGPIWPPADQRPISRTYTVARYDAAAGELDVDFVLHGDDGPASRWALHAKAGDAIGVAGPAGPDRHQRNADFYLLVGDPSSLAALSAVLNALPADARGYALVEVPNRDEIMPLPHPVGVELQWLSRDGAAAGASTRLLDAVRNLAWPTGRVSVTLAGESTQVVAIRDWLLHERKLPRDMLYAVPYWKDTYTEEAYHAERHRIMDELEEVAK
ncbi:siderophore-interacting protein [Chitinimonas sp. BJB300]|uniref:siderophore-interacting protein n=1 Tax=Chitinimonas sp. BJB300 TaxID=1559339 RepID=UPI000C0D515B|nr:siderophore-interacting protein [Chitinimonas sp. BJB300]PHV11874.1 NADPH-dependent ferric siderophore reductase [Chitinimonas sp. BJB300]TSJ87767.1 siderophore-interacting protein [Chitinimonas sp. BJB300]